MTTARVLVALCVLVGACGSAAEPPVSTVEDGPAADPERAFSALVEALASEDQSGVVDVTAPSQIPLLAIAEGLDGRAVADLAVADRRAIAENYWRGFADQLRASTGSGLGDLEIQSVDRIEVAGVEWGLVHLADGGDSFRRRLVFREEEGGWVIDLIATFPSPMLGVIPNAAQLIRSTGDATLGATLRGWEPSVRFVLEEQDVDPLLQQAGMAALEAIIR